MRLIMFFVSCFVLMVKNLESVIDVTITKTIETFSHQKVYFYATFVAVLSFSLLGLSTIAYAQDISTDGGLVQYILENFMNAKSAGTVALALFISKILLFAFNTPTFGKLLDKLTGKVKLVVTMALTYVVGVLTAMVVKDVSIAVALFDSANIPLLGLLLNQVYKQFVEKASEPSKAAQAAIVLR